ncbi:MAG TPA: L-idonate 5-dehydrogenase, partial [Vicinamibacteria bacterium]|nr:L-idonate 5-dehydrogenase [Vicinamibacteria bacterium]
LHGPRDLRLEERPVPELLPGTVLLRVRRAGLCGTDVHYFEEGRVGSFVATAPFVLGHELCGEVVAVARGSAQPAPGTRVVVNPARQCGHCDYCRAGRGNLCRHLHMLGSASTTPPTDGGFAQYLRVGAEQCFAMPPQMDDGLGAMMEPFAVALHALSRAGSVAGARVVVSGGGPIGLLTVLAARTFGATTVALSDPVAERRSMARRLGADAVLDPAAESFAAEAAAVAADGFCVLFEASGSPSALRQAFELVRRGGTIVQIGSFSEPEIPLPVGRLLVKELRLVGSFRYGNVWEQAIRLVASGRVDLQPLISDVLPLSRAREALELASRRGAAVKVQLDLG